MEIIRNREIYNVIKDPLEKNKIAEKDLNPEQQKLIAIFRGVFKRWYDLIWRQTQ